MKVTITRAGGYDPKLGPKHPDNQDPTLVASTIEDGVLQRTVKINANNGRVTVSEVDDNTTYVTVMDDRERHATVELDATQLWNLAAGIIELHGGVALRYDDHRARANELRTKLFDVLQANESRCLDDNIDRDVVLSELLKALT